MSPLDQEQWDNLSFSSWLKFFRQEVGSYLFCPTKKNFLFSHLNLFLFFPECDGVYCGQGAQCIVTPNGATCKCVEGFLGNPFPGGDCLPDVCSASNPCSDPFVCIGGRCKERCEGVVCGIGAVCDRNTNKCVCEPFFVGNPDHICMPRKLEILF